MSTADRVVARNATLRPVVAAVRPPADLEVLDDLASHAGLVLAVSGGPDSTALLWCVAHWRASLSHGPRLLAVTVDHRLRPESSQEAEAVRRLAVSLGVPHRTLPWTGIKPATGLQEAARAARYRLLAGAAYEAGASAVLTAHTRDDQAETVLMRMARGSGLTGLAGMARTTSLASPGPHMIALVRPFLDIPKARLIATLEAAGIPFAEDPSNRDVRFTRARMRALAPALAAEGLDAGRLATLARRLARAEAALAAAAEDAWGRLCLEAPSARRVALDAGGFAALPAEIALRVLTRAVAQVGDQGHLELGKLEALLAALANASRADDPSPRFRRSLGGALVTSKADRLVVERAPARRARTEDRAARPASREAVASAFRERPIVKEIGPIPLADGPGGPTLAEGRSSPHRIASTTLTAGPPARRKGRQ